MGDLSKLSPARRHGDISRYHIVPDPPERGAMGGFEVLPKKRIPANSRPPLLIGSSGSTSVPTAASATASTGPTRLTSASQAARRHRAALAHEDPRLPSRPALERAHRGGPASQAGR